MNTRDEFYNRLLKRFLFFTLGFFGALAVFAIINLVAAHFQSDCGIMAVLGRSGCADDIVRAGFPLLVLERGGFAYRDNFDLAAFVIDALIALGVSGVAGLACARMFGRDSRLPPDL